MRLRKAAPIFVFSDGSDLAKEKLRILYGAFPKCFIVRIENEARESHRCYEGFIFAHILRSLSKLTGAPTKLAIVILVFSSLNIGKRLTVDVFSSSCSKISSSVICNSSFICMYYIQLSFNPNSIVPSFALYSCSASVTSFTEAPSEKILSIVNLNFLYLSG